MAKLWLRKPDSFMTRKLLKKKRNKQKKNKQNVIMLTENDNLANLLVQLVKYMMFPYLWIFHILQGALVSLNCSEFKIFHLCIFFMQHDDVEFEILANYLNLCTLPPRDEKQPSLYSARCVQFAHEKPSDLITVWCKQLIKVVKRQPTKAKVSSTR